jgi:hypothetical protein
VGARFSAPVHTGLGDHPASYTVATGSFPGLKRPGRDVEHPLRLALRLKWYSDSLRAGRSGDRIPAGGDIFRARPHGYWGPPSLLYNGYRVSILVVKRPERGVDQPPLYSAEVKERVELYIHSSSGLSWPVLRVTFIWSGGRGRIVKNVPGFHPLVLLKGIT